VSITTNGLLLERDKELKHRINEPGFVRPARAMSPIGG
jgi:hypothetical protein